MKSAVNFKAYHDLPYYAKTIEATALPLLLQSADQQATEEWLY